MNNSIEGSGSQVIHTVSQITTKVKSLLEKNFPFIWITGEISNFSSPLSGHYYFSLKDENAQISAVMFRGQNRNMKFSPGNGMAVTGFGRITLYKPRGTYQIILEYLEPKGVGALQVSFEQLKARLYEEGLFDEERKKPLPFLPGKIALITSPTGAVVYDMLKIARRRFENMHLMVVPVKVQGPGAVEDLVGAIETVNDYGGVDVAIVARGGGSLEDLQAFNSEKVARAIAGSLVPVVSAVGHETDYTISDFVADLRAPTPSAAAEMVVPRKDQIASRIAEFKDRLCGDMAHRLREAGEGIERLSEKLVDPVKKPEALGKRCDELYGRCIRAISNVLMRQRELLGRREDMLQRVPIPGRLAKHSQQIDHLSSKLLTSFNRRKTLSLSEHRVLDQKLTALSPLSILDRGYSITRNMADREIVRTTDQVNEKQLLEIILSRGALEVTVTGKTCPEKTQFPVEKERRLDGDTNI
jgi:exodeoxyribonuclease VII large subunit